MAQHVLRDPNGSEFLLDDSAASRLYEALAASGRRPEVRVPNELDGLAEARLSVWCDPVAGDTSDFYGREKARQFERDLRAGRMDP